MSVDCYCDYGEPATVYRAKIVRARKAYRCDECAGAIVPREQYEYVFAVWDGNADQIRTCARCIDLQTWTRNNVPCFCPMHGNMDEQMEEAIVDAISRAPAETQGLRFGFLRRKVLRDKYNTNVRAA